MVFGAIMGAGASLLGMDKQEHAADRAARQAAASRDMALQGLQRGRGQHAKLFGIARDYLTDRIAKADSALATAGAGAHRDIRATHERSMANTSEALARRGLGMTAANMGTFWDQFGRTRAAHEMQSGQALSGLFGNYADSRYAMQLDRANVLLGRQAPAPTGQAEAYGELGGALGSALDQYLDSKSIYSDGQDNYTADDFEDDGYPWSLGE